MVVLQIFGSWDQEIDSWFMNHEPLIPTLRLQKRLLLGIKIDRKIGIPFYCSSCGFRREQGDSVRDRNN